MPRPTTTLRRFALFCAAGLLLPLLGAAAGQAFSSGSVFWAPGSCSGPCELFDLTGGGDFSGAPAFAIIGPAFGQIAWDGNLAYAYATQFSSNEVVRISPAGVVETFASGISSPTGLLWTQDGRLLVASFYGLTVYDITAGDAAPPIAFATGLSQPRNLLQLETGQILLADQGRRQVIDISAGGDMSGAPAFASGFASGPYDVVKDGSGGIFASSLAGIFDITSGGSVAGTSPHAHGRTFLGLAVDGAGRLLASATETPEIFDVTNGGNLSQAAPFAWNLRGFADTALDSVPEPAPPECANGRDDDGDGMVDAPADPGCDSAEDLSEHSPLLPCDDGVDNDGDGSIDYPTDPGCGNATSPRENPKCQDGLDNDGDGAIDWNGGPGGEPADLQCAGNPTRNREKKKQSCGLGFELVGVLLLRLRRRSARL